MPNHIHGIVEIINEDDNWARHAEPLQGNSVDCEHGQFRKPVHGSIPTIIRSFKSEATKRFCQMTDKVNFPFWQRNYYDHIIRNDKEYQKVYDYIQANPLNWLKDEEFSC